MRVCGLKQIGVGKFVAVVFTPHAGVWIETCKSFATQSEAQFTPHAGVWIETQSHQNPNQYLVHTPCGCVD